MLSGCPVQVDSSSGQTPSQSHMADEQGFRQVIYQLKWSLEYQTKTWLGQEILAKGKLELKIFFSPGYTCRTKVSGHIIVRCINFKFVYKNTDMTIHVLFFLFVEWYCHKSSSEPFIPLTSLCWWGYGSSLPTVNTLHRISSLLYQR